MRSQWSWLFLSLFCRLCVSFHPLVVFKLLSVLLFSSNATMISHAFFMLIRLGDNELFGSLEWTFSTNLKIFQPLIFKIFLSHSSSPAGTPVNYVWPPNIVHRSLKLCLFFLTIFCLYLDGIYCPVSNSLVLSSAVSNLLLRLTGEYFTS